MPKRPDDAIANHRAAGPPGWADIEDYIEALEEQAGLEREIALIWKERAEAAERKAR